MAAILEVLGLVLMMRQGEELILLLRQVVELLWFFVLQLLRLSGRTQNLGETHEIHFQKRRRVFTGIQRLANNIFETTSGKLSFNCKKN